MATDTLPPFRVQPRLVCAPRASAHNCLTDGSRSCYARPYRDCSCCGHSAPFSGRREYLREMKTPPHSSWASSSETPARVQNTNASADLSPCNGIFAILGQHEACPDSDNNERTRPAPTPSVRTSQSIHRHFVPLDSAHNDYDASLTFISEDIVLFWHSATTPRSRRYMPRTTPESKNASAAKYATLIRNYGNSNAKI